MQSEGMTGRGVGKPICIRSERTQSRRYWTLSVRIGQLPGSEKEGRRTQILRNAPRRICVLYRPR